MSIEVNSVGKYFVLTVDNAAATGTETLDTLAVGQVGYYTENNTPALVANGVQKFYAATVLSDGTLVKTGIIDPTKLRYSSYTENTSAISPVYDIENICSSCSKDYAIKLDILDAAAFQGYGFQPYTKLYSGYTSCCGDETDSCIQLIKDLRDGINADPEGLVVASARNPANDAELNDAALDAWDVDANGCPNLRLEVQAKAVNDFCNLPYNYSFPTNVSIKISTIGFDCCSPAVAVTMDTPLVYGSGLGIDVKYQEFYHLKNSLANTQYHVTEDGVVDSLPLNTDISVNYDLSILAYDDPIRSGFLGYSDPQTLTIATSEPNSGSNNDVILSAITGITFA